MVNGATDSLLVKTILDAHLSSQEEGIFGGFLKLCGQRFWEFISGNEDLYTDIIEPLGHKAKEKNEEFLIEYTKVINKFTLEFSKEYCAPDGSILWKKLVRFNSGKKAE